MWVKAQASALSVLCSAAVVATTAVPLVPTAHPTVTRGADYRYALTAATIDAAFNPIQYLGGLGGAAQAVASDVIYWQTPDFPLLVLSAQVDPGTGEYTAVQKVNSTATDLQNLVGAVTAFPGASSSTQVKQLVSGIGAAGSAAATATHTITATLAPHLAPLTPVIYVVKVLSAAVGVYYAVATLSTTGVSTVLSGHNPLTAVANVVSSVQGLANAIAGAPHPLASRSTAAAIVSTPTPSQLAAKTGATTATAAQTGEKTAATTTATPRTRAGRSTTGVKSPDAQAESPTDNATSPKPSTTPTKSKPSSAPKSATASDSHTEQSAESAKQPAGGGSASTPSAKRTAKSSDHAGHDGGSSHAESAPKSKSDH